MSPSVEIVELLIITFPPLIATIPWELTKEDVIFIPFIITFPVPKTTIALFCP